MKILPLTILAAWAVLSATCANSAPVAAPDKPAFDHGQFSVIGSRGRATFDGLVRAPAECMPDRAEPVWGATSALLGYTCVRNENGG
jgi:hypothetical protein